MGGYLERSVDPILADLLRELPALLIVGPRASGKTTTAARHAATVIRLDREAEAEAMRADPDAALRGLPEPVLLDEWQAVPGVLGAVKRSVDLDPHAGRFILTGSVRADLDTQTWPGTGRVVRLAMAPLTVAEQQCKPAVAPLLDRLARGEPLEVGEDPPDLRGYVELALRGGFPDATVQARSAGASQRWLESYVDQLITRDALGIDGGRDPARLRRYLEAYTLNSAGLATDRTIWEGAGVNRRTALAYERLLENLLVVESVPAWTSNRLSRLIRSPKRYLVDASLFAAAIRVDVDAVMRDGDLLGRVLDTFVAAQLRVEPVVATTRPRLFHLRQEQGRHEVDVVAELGGQRVIGIEVKATAGPSAEAARHLVWMRDQLGDRFLAGVVLHSGPHRYRLAERIVAAPICVLWN
jgi:predicted AAA+ superfamily ATPase